VCLETGENEVTRNDLAKLAGALWFGAKVALAAHLTVFLVRLIFAA
jgi:hypothetical protein